VVWTGNETGRGGGFEVIDVARSKTKKGSDDGLMILSKALRTEGNGLFVQCGMDEKGNVLIWCGGTVPFLLAHAASK
jgi:hypothetical protein